MRGSEDSAPGSPGELAVELQCPANRRADEPRRRREQRAPRPGELRRVIDEGEQRRGRRERRHDRLGARIQLPERRVELEREAVGDVRAEAPQLGPAPSHRRGILRGGGTGSRRALPAPGSPTDGRDGTRHRAARARAARASSRRRADPRRRGSGSRPRRSRRAGPSPPLAATAGLAASPPPAGGGSRPFRRGSPRGRR